MPLSLSCSKGSQPVVSLTPRSQKLFSQPLWGTLPGGAEALGQDQPRVCPTEADLLLGEAGVEFARLDEQVALSVLEVRRRVQEGRDLR